MKKTAGRAFMERIQGEAPSRWRAAATSASAGVVVAVAIYRVLRQPE
jgi:hypothetical protein